MTVSTVRLYEDKDHLLIHELSNGFILSVRPMTFGKWRLNRTRKEEFERQGYGNGW